MTISQTLQSWLPPYATRQSCTPERDAAEYALLSPEARDEADNEAVIAVSPRASRTTYRITILLLSLMSVTVASLVVLPATFHTLQLDARSSQQCTTLAEAFKGSWLPHSPPILSASALGPNISDWSVSALSCDSKDNNTDVERVLRVANWDWTPQSCEMRPWDAEQVVRHLLRSPYGVIFAGDSIAGQHLNAFAARLNVQSSPALTVPSSHGIEGVGGSAGHILNPLHPLYTTLLEEGTFSDTRLKRPILVRLTSYHLGTNTQLKSALRAGYPGSQATRLTSRYSWGSDADVGETMRDVMEMYGGEDETATAPTYLVLNSGAHWSTYRFEGLDPVDNSTQLVSAYATVITGLVERLQALPHASDSLRIIGRTNTAPPQTCLETEPLLSPNDATPSTHDYHLLFPTFDRVLRLLHQPPSIEIMDIFNMVTLRPDARRLPPVDCLHVCFPVAWPWVESLWGLMGRDG